MPDEEKKMVLTNALEDWIKGMMSLVRKIQTFEEVESAATFVKAWDVVNEADTNWYPSQLKSGTTEGEENVAPSLLATAREVVKFARKYGGET